MQEFKATIGQRLKQIRLSRQISLDKAADATHIRPHYLQALEEDNYSAMSSAAQGRGFLQLYADFLGLDLEAAMSELRHAEKTDATPAPESVTPPPAPVSAPQTPPASSTDERLPAVRFGRVSCERKFPHLPLSKRFLLSRLRLLWMKRPPFSLRPSR